MLCRIIRGGRNHEIGDGNNQHMLNWAEYNDKLVRRGEILIELEFLSNRGKKGRPINIVIIE